MNKEKQDFIEKLNSRFGLLAIGVLIFAAYLGITNSGLAKTINIWQIQILNGSYFKYVSIFLIAILLFIPVFIIRVFVIFLYNKKFSNQPEMQLPYFKKL